MASSSRSCPPKKYRELYTFITVEGVAVFLPAASAHLAFSKEGAYILVFFFSSLLLRSFTATYPFALVFL